MDKSEITPDQVAQIREKLPEEIQDEGFVVKVFVALKGHWRASIEFPNGEGLLLEG